MQRRKLVRDRVRFLNLNDKHKGMVRPEFILAEPNELKMLLIDKMDEEWRELQRAILDGDVDAMAEELADCREVLKKMGEEFAGVGEEAVSQLQRQKRQAKGGFDAGTVLVWDDADLEKEQSQRMERICGRPAAPPTFFLNEQHTTHVSKAQARRERAQAKGLKIKKKNFLKP